MTGLGPNELLTTTRAVRKRLGLSRPVERSVIEEGIAVASQAPNADNRQLLHFVAVTDKDKRASLAEVYRRCSAIYFASPRAATETGFGNPVRHEAMKRKFDSELYLNEHLHEVQVHVIPASPAARTASMYLPRPRAGVPYSQLPGVSYLQVVRGG